MENMTLHPLAKELKEWKLVLGSKSPRRIQLLRELGLDFTVRPSDADEIPPKGLCPSEVPSFLSELKAKALRPHLAQDELLITADTIVIHKDQILGKPQNIEEAKAYLTSLSEDWHTVITSYTLSTKDQQVSESISSEIFFTKLTEDEIEYYISKNEVLDKAGAYGVQDWIGLIGVTELRGSYHNVMGLPTASIYHRLKKFLEDIRRG